MPTVDVKNCQRACWNKCMCTRQFKMDISQRRTQVMVNHARDCHTKCGGGGIQEGKRRLQPIIKWKTRSEAECKRIKFGTCYWKKLAQRLKPKNRRLQPVLSNEQIAQGQCREATKFREFTSAQMAPALEC